MSKQITHIFIIGTFVLLYAMTSIVSTIHVVDFFRMSNPNWLAISLAIAFEVGAAASLAAIITLSKMNKAIVWGLFIILTAMQAMGNTYYTYVHLTNFQGWIELFGLVDEDIIVQKRILAIVSGAILPIVALGFIKALVDYIKPNGEFDNEAINQPIIQTAIAEQINRPEVIETPLIIDSDIPVITNEEITQPVVLKTEEVIEPMKTTTAIEVDNNIDGHMTEDAAIARGIQNSSRITFTDHT